MQAFDGASGKKKMGKFHSYKNREGKKTLIDETLQRLIRNEMKNTKNNKTEAFSCKASRQHHLSFAMREHSYPRVMR